MQAETDLQRQKQDHRGETLGLTGKGAGREGGGAGGVREAGGFTEEWTNTSDETLDTRTASYKWHGLFRGKLVKCIDSAEDERDLNRTNNTPSHSPDW